MDGQAHDTPSEPADQAGQKKGVRGLFGKVNKTKVLNSWLEDTALGELIGVGQNADSTPSRINAGHSNSRQTAAAPSGAGAGNSAAAAGPPAEARSRSGRRPASHPAAAGQPDLLEGDGPRADSQPRTGRQGAGKDASGPPARKRSRPATSVAARRPRTGPQPAAVPAPAEPAPAPTPPSRSYPTAAANPATSDDADGTEPDLKADGYEPADAAAAIEADVTSTQPIRAARDVPAGTEPAGPHHPRTGHLRARRPLTGPPLSGAPLMSKRPRINPHLRSDPRLRIWITRIIVMVVLFAGFTIWRDWRYGVTAAIIYAVADLVYRSKTTAPVPAGVRVTSAQRYTRRRLRVLQPAGYMSLHARRIPGTNSVIDHVVVGPAGVFTLDSQRLDRRLPLTAIGGMIYHGRTSMEGRLDHAKDESRQAAKLIADELGRRVRVKPAMVMYGPSISWVIMPVKGVDVFDGSRIGTYFRRQTKLSGQYKLTSGQIAMVFAAAARALPPLN